MAESYYAARSRRDPAWRLRAIAAAAERKRRRRKQDPDGARVAHRQAMQRYRARLRAHGLTFTELLHRSRAAAGTTASAIGDPDVLRLVLADEVRRGRVDYSGGRYLLNGGLPADVRLALRDLEL